MAAHERTIPELIKTAKVLQEKADQAANKSSQFLVSLGLTLGELKEKPRPKGVTWPMFVKKHFGYGQQRADELIQIGSGGAAALEKSRERNRDAVRKSRKKKEDSLLRNSDPKTVKKVEDKSKAQADTDKTEKPDAKPETKAEAVAAPNYKAKIDEALRHAQEITSADFEVTTEIVSLATKAAEAWSDIVTELTKRQKQKRN